MGQDTRRCGIVRVLGGPQHRGRWSLVAIAALVSIAGCGNPPKTQGTAETGDGGGIVITHCVDHLLDADETDVDCGGPTCRPCSAGTTCRNAGDCGSRSCAGGLCVAPASCSDQVLNGSETDVDCGGGACAACALTKTCLVAADCTSQICTAGTCATAGCGDGILDGDETDVDCGGFTCPACAPGKMCAAGFQCTSGLCTGGLCTTPSCVDNVKNLDETDVDCGGATCAPCQVGGACLAARDCNNGRCDSEVCAPVITPLNVPVTLAATSSIDSADGKTIYLTGLDWSVASSGNAGSTFSGVFTGAATYKQGAARVHASRAKATDVVVYAYTDVQISTVDTTLVVTHDAFASITINQNDVFTAENISAFSLTDTNSVYFLANQFSSKYSANAGDTSTEISTAPFPLLCVNNSLWLPGAAEINPTDSNLVWLSCRDWAGMMPRLTKFNRTTQSVTDLSSLVSGLGGVGGFEVYARAPGYRMRVVGKDGGVMTSDDLGTSFQPAGANGTLTACANFQMRQIASYAGGHNRVATWCPKAPDLSFSADGGAHWMKVLSPTWSSLACQVSGAVVTATQVLVSCQNRQPLALTF